MQKNYLSIRFILLLAFFLTAYERVKSQLYTRPVLDVYVSNKNNICALVTSPAWEELRPLNKN